VGDARAGLAAGKLVFDLHGHKLAGRWELVRISKPGERQIPWLLFKKRDAHARAHSDYDVVSALPDSVIRHPPGPVRAPGAARVPALPGVPLGRSARHSAPASRAAQLSGAVKAALPVKLPPQLATLATEVPAHGDWIYEIKFDGYRLMSRIEGGVARLITRGGHDWSSKMPELVASLQHLGWSSAWLDGEIVVLGDDGTPDFQALQNAFDHARSADIVYFLFDLPCFDGHDLRAVTLRDRRAFLKSLLERQADGPIRFSADFEAHPAHILQSACEMGLEGLIAKRSDAPYVSRRADSWLKLKCRHRQEFVIGGFTERNADPKATEIGSLLLGFYDAEGRLVFAGSVGTGWDVDVAARLKSSLAKIEVATSPFAEGAAIARAGRWSKRIAGSERWVKPQRVAEVSFAGWTASHQLRHATFEGLRMDKPAKSVTRESVVRPKGETAARPKGTANVAAVAPRALSSTATKVTHPERVVDASSGATKLDLVRYYESVAPWMLPHLKGRPCSLVRGPSGIEGQLFFQRHADNLQIPGVKSLDPCVWPGHEALLEVPSAKALAAAAQMNVIEFHTWNALARISGKPDRIVFDLDPGEGVAWARVLEAATLTRGFLAELGLQAWLKTSGGKGLHLVVPLSPRHDWETAKGFSEAVVQHLAQVVPDRFAAKSGPRNRVGKVFVDYLRNSQGATTAAAYSARARPGLGVSMPVSWDMLASLKRGSQWTIVTAREHLSFQTEDPWSAYWTCRQTLTRPMKALNYRPPSPTQPE
jgi:bifunctional non-homologous end joining protein LigD